MSETHHDTHAPLEVDDKAHYEDQSYRYLPLGGRILDREHIITLIDHRSRLLAPGIEVVFASERLAPLLIQNQADQEVLLNWYLRAHSSPPQPFLQLGTHLLSRAHICELLESGIEGDTTLLLRYNSLPDLLMGDAANSSIQTLELRGQTADAVRHWLAAQTEVIVPLRPAASLPSTALGFMQESPSCPHCESWLTPHVDQQTQRTLTLVCPLCQYTDGPFTRNEDPTPSTNAPKKG
ncbi:hypothetical protein KSC_001470 [Ktedonobacter sp. SOSP1-52]|uniref:hypothetical protein n=1 Tax=Ktedonobacter sp. SOSP1-52 TaxID=2778366 RepID=UPI00191678D7|nr:hypothetical protein [Ktedonobacter sp. SOSP1-52]GHO61255.1 hypothetical protein KSC_001470 [Ktedonobacter sp. SOSP1-52]